MAQKEPRYFLIMFSQLNFFPNSEHMGKAACNDTSLTKFKVQTINFLRARTRYLWITAASTTHNNVPEMS